MTFSWCMFVSCYYIFLFETVLIIHMAYKVFQKYIFSLSVHLFVCKSFRSSVCSSICQLLDESFAFNIFIAYISVTILQIFLIFELLYHKPPPPPPPPPYAEPGSITMFYVKYFGCSFLFKMHVNLFSYMVHDISVHVDFKRYI